MVSEKKIFFYVFLTVSLWELLTPRVGAIFDSRGIISRIYVKLQITMLHTKYGSFGSCSFREDKFSMYFPLLHVFPTMANDDAPGMRSWACMDPRGMVGRIYKDDHYTLLHTEYESSGPCG